MGKYEKANELAILAAGRMPAWQEQEDYDGPPPLAGSGISVTGSIQTLVSIDLRANVHRRQALVTVTTLDLANTYTVTINGTACVATGPFADRAEVINDIVTAINGSAQAAVVTASAEDLDAGVAGVETVKIVGDVDTDFTITMSATGTGVLAVVADATEATARIYGTAGGTNPATPWKLLNEASFTIGSHGFMERLETAGLDRLYVELDDVDGAGDGASVTYAPVVSVGPCVTE